MSIDVFSLPVFAAADVFPMMADDELRELAEDIRENGVREPIVIANGELIDGRNRRAACKIAGVTPPTRELNGEDPTAYVLSANIHRRHMTKGQRAMAVAMIYPDLGQRGRGNKSVINTDFASSYLKHARAIFSHSRTLAAAVLAGARPLADAYQEVLQATGKFNNESKRLRDLRADRPDLADAVEAEEISLDEALRKAASEAEQRKSQRWAFTRNLIDGVRGLERDIEQSKELAREYDPACAEGFNEKITPERLRRAAAFAVALAEQMENGNA